MTTNVPQTTDNTIDPALVAPDSYRPSLRERLAELSHLMLRNCLPDVQLDVRPDNLVVQAQDTTAVDAWVAALGANEPHVMVHEYADRSPLWVYKAYGTWLGQPAEVFVLHNVPTGDELVEQPAVAA